MALKTMSISQLIELKEKLDAVLASKVAEQRKTLQSQLSNLDRMGSKSATGRRGGPRGKVEPKYRNPANSSETWAGRGLKPRWLAQALKGGKKLEDFAIGKVPGKRGRKPGK